MRKANLLPLWLVIIFVILAIGLSGGRVLAADPIPGLVGPDPANGTGFDIEGCNLDKDTEGTYDPNATPPVLVCDDTSYTDGNLGKQWEELDLVPHRILIESYGAPTQTFQFALGADNKVSESPLAIGYDRIANFVFNSDLSTGDASDCQLSLIGGNSIGDFGIGGAILQIVQVVEITQTAETLCVWDYVERLAITASNISGSSNRSFVVGAAESIPIPSDVQPQVLSKSMSAVEDSLVSWTIQKDADPVTLDFSNTCDPTNPVSKDVTVTIDFTRGAADPYSLTATTQIQATNPSSRNVTYDCEDNLYGVLEGETLESLVSTETVVEVVEPGMDTIPLEHVLDAGTRQLRNELTCELSVEDILNPGNFIIVGTLDAQFTLPDGDITAGTVVNDMVTITDVENITGTGFEFSAVQDFTGVTGAFSGYTAGTSTTGPVTWISDSQNTSGSIEFTKSVTVDRFITSTGTLSDTATLPLSGATDVDASASTSLSTSALVELTIDKTIQDILQDTDTITCNFEVKNSSDVVVGTPSLVFVAGDTNKTTTLTGLAPDTYTVIEGECGGLVASGGNSQTVDLNLTASSTFADCSDTAFFTNIVGAGSAVAEVKKITNPAGYESGWEFTLNECIGPMADPCSDLDPLATVTTTDADFERFRDNLLNDYTLYEGTFLITETLQSGWENTASAGCEFTINFPDDFGAVKQCTYTNRQLGTIIIEKVTDPADTSPFTAFDFTDDIESPNAFTLYDGDDKTFLDVSAGTYMVTEDDPTPDYDLTDISCVEDATENTTTSLTDRKATIELDPGETVTCTFTNTERGMVELLKLTNGVESSMNWSFTLTGEGVNESDSSPPTIVDFGGVKLIPGEEYTLCETGIPAGWTLEWMVDTDDDGVPDTIIPMVADTNYDPIDPATGYSRVYDPNYVTPPDTYTNDTRCVNFEVGAAETLAFQIDNQFPGGEPRTIGYWKNWNTCTGGNQWLTAENNGGPDAGWYILDDLLNNPGFTIGILTLGSGDCVDAVNILDKRDLNGKKKASDAAYNLAAQLLGAMLNLSAGAETCTGVVDAVNAAQALLAGIGFDGTGNFLRPKDTLYSQANDLAYTLDEYNNGDLCP